MVDTNILSTPCNALLALIKLLIPFQTNYTFTNDYKYLLESPKNYSLGDEKIKQIDMEDTIIKTINQFMNNNNLFENGVIVSLSGGVDSMIILASLLRIRREKFFKIYACAINYNLRKESNDEFFVKTHFVAIN